jgi:hypothetical protein
MFKADQSDPLAADRALFRFDTDADVTVRTISPRVALYARPRAQVARQE